MFAFLKRHRELLLVMGLLLYPLVMFLTAGKRSRENFFLDRALLACTVPLQRLMSGAVEGGKSTWAHYISLRGVKRDNDALREENARLHAEVNGLQEARAENERLKRLLSFSDANPGIKIPAHMVGVGPDPQHQLIRIDRGDQDGVTRRMAVVMPDGIVGQVVRANATFADVMLLTDASSRIGVRVKRSRSRATASGTGEGNLRLDNALKSEALENGDEVITSGTDGVYPPGLLVGRVAEVQRTSGGMFWTASVIPAVDTSRLEELFVVPTALPAGASDAQWGPASTPKAAGRR